MGRLRRCEPVLLLIGLACICWFCFAGGLFLISGCSSHKHGSPAALPAPTSDVPHFDCKAVNLPIEEIHKGEDGRGYVIEIDDWRVTCQITRGSELLWEKELPLARPTAYQEAMDAINVFRKRANEILNDKKEN